MVFRIHFGALFHTQALHTAFLIQAEFITASDGYRVKHATIHRMIHTTVDNKRLNNDAIQKIQPHKLCALVCVIESEKVDAILKSFLNHPNGYNRFE